MSSSKVKNEISFKKGDFWIAYSLWIVSILLNTIPTVYKVLNEWLNLEASSLENFNPLLEFISDYEFMYIFCSSGFILILELFFFKRRIEWYTEYSAIFWVVFFYSIILLVLYTIASFNPYWSNRISVGLVANINFIAFAFLFVIGTLYFILANISTRKLIL